MMLCDIIVTLPVFHAVFRIFEKSIGLWTIEVIALTTFIIAGSTVTIPLSTANVGGEITPSMNRVKQIVVFACDVGSRCSIPSILNNDPDQHRDDFRLVGRLFHR